MKIYENKLKNIDKYKYINWLFFKSIQKYDINYMKYLNNKYNDIKNYNNLIKVLKYLTKGFIAEKENNKNEIESNYKKLYNLVKFNKENNEFCINYSKTIFICGYTYSLEMARIYFYGFIGPRDIKKAKEIINHIPKDFIFDNDLQINEYNKIKNHKI